jgi:2-(1,2-epoxy-1,2-dihydrophenyl)acetyl-CoA isomerase
MAETPILVEARAGYRVITLNRPARLNAFTEAMPGAAGGARAEVEADSGCRALLSSPVRAVACAGQDLNDRLSQAGETPVLGGRSKPTTTRWCASCTRSHSPWSRP